MPFLFLLLLAFFISLFSSYFVRKLAFKLNLVDDKKHRQHPAQIHQGTIPRAGGLALYLGVVIPVLLFLPVNKVLCGILLGASLTTLIGLLDDWKDLNPYLRFIFNIITALIVIAVGVGIPFINNPFDGVIRLDTIRLSFNFFGEHSILILADLLALFYIVWLMNIVGWSGGVDGQLSGFVAIAALVLALLSLRFSAHDISQNTITSLALITMGSYLGFLPWNFYPQKIMPGYSGKTLAGFLLAVLSILSGAKVGTMLLVLGLPATDAVFTILRRILKGQSPVWADQEHLHHRLLKRGWGKRKIALFYWLISAFLGFLALTVSAKQKIFVLLTLFCVVGGMILWTEKFKKEITRTSSRKWPKSNLLNPEV